MRSVKSRVFKVILIPLIMGLGLAWLFIPGIRTMDGAWVSAALSLDAGAPPGELRVVHSDATSLILELNTPGFDLEQGSVEGQPCQTLLVEGFASSGKAGQPILPARGAMLGIPPEASPVLTILEAEPVLLLERYDLCPAAQPSVDVDFSGKVQYLGQAIHKDPQAYSQDRFLPDEIANLASTGFLRSQKVAQVLFQPFQYNPVSGELRYYRRIRVQVNFPGASLSTAPGTETVDEVALKEGAFEDLLKTSLVNYEQARSWRLSPDHAATASAPAAPTANYEFKLSVNQDGIYQVSYEDLVAAGADLTGVHPATLQLFNQGAEVAISVVDDGDALFESGEYFLFYGQQVDTKYTATNVYFLTWGEAGGMRMDVLNGTVTPGASVPSSFDAFAHLEGNIGYNSDHPSGPDNDVWYWGGVMATSGPASRSYPFTLNNIAPSSPVSATVSGLLKGYSAIPHHHVRVRVNGHTIVDTIFAPQAELTFSMDIPQSYLLEGSNSLVMELPFDGGISLDAVLMNWFGVDYRDTFVAENDLLHYEQTASGNWEYQITGFTTDLLEVLDITDPTMPYTISNILVQPDGGGYQLSFRQDTTEARRYVAQAKAERLSPLSILPDHASDLHSTSNGADYIIITHSEFYNEVLPLVALRTAQGLRTKVVDVEDVYDEFNAGIMHPRAIRDFLQYAYNNWLSPAPLYALLVGDGNFDPRHYVHAEPNYIPPYLEQVDPWIGETAAENRFVTFIGTDLLPDMFLGRLPVQTSDQAQVIVDKILGYEQEPPDLDLWNGRVLFVADDPDGAGAFNVYSDHIADDPYYLPARFVRQKVFYLITHMTTLNARNAILGGINQGALMVNYIGHGGTTLWADELLLSTNSLPSMTNGDMLPFFVAMTCLEGSFHYPSIPTQDNSSLAEVLLRASGKGSIANWTPTGFGVVYGHDFLNRGLYEAIFADGVYELGAAVTQAKLFLYANTAEYRDMLDTYAFFGDPAMDLHRYYVSNLPLVFKEAVP